MSSNYSSKNYLHFPLIYSTRIYSELEAYTKAAINFTDRIDSYGNIGATLIDDCVVKFDFSNFQKAILDVLIKGQKDRELCVQVYSKINSYTNKIPSTLIWLESNIKRIDLHYIHTLEVAYNSIIELIAINHFNVFFETYFLYLNKQFSDRDFFKTLQEKYFYDGNGFSHISWFKSNLQELTQQFPTVCNKEIILNNFYWNSSFLQATEPCINDLSEIIFLNKHLGINYDGDFYLAEKNLPNTGPSILPDPAISGKYLPAFENAIHQILFMTRALTANEEFRHYWQARFFRLIRLLLKNQSAIERYSFEMTTTYLKRNAGII